MTHYDTLGIPETAGQDEIKRAYRKLASQHHPDKGGDTKRFQEIQTAYDAIGDEQRRAQYDAQRKGGGPGVFHWQSGDGGFPPDINEIFKNFGFGFGPQGPFQHGPRRNKDLRVEVHVPLASTLAEQVKLINVATTNGHRETVEVRIPRGVTNETNIKYTGLGDNLFNTLPRGDLYVQIRVFEPENFRVNGVDLYTKSVVNCFVAVAGGKIKVQGIDGREWELTVPPGVQPGIKFRIPEQGICQLNGNQRGDLYVELGITIPQNLTAEQLEIVRSLIPNQ